MAQPYVLLLSATLCALLFSSTHARTLAQVSGAIALLLCLTQFCARPSRSNCRVDRSTHVDQKFGQKCAIAGILLRHLSPVHLFVLCRVTHLCLTLQGTATPMVTRSPQQDPGTGKRSRTVCLPAKSWYIRTLNFTARSLSF